MSLYEAMGGEAGVRALVEAFYDVMDTLSEAQDIRAMHPADLTESRRKLFFFLSGWAGGPPLYMQTYGHPRLRMRHLPFAIGGAERDQWLLCMNIALEATPMHPAARAHLQQAFAQIAEAMRNQAEDETTS